MADHELQATFRHFVAQGRLRMNRESMAERERLSASIPRDRDYPVTFRSKFFRWEIDAYRAYVTDLIGEGLAIVERRYGTAAAAPEYAWLKDALTSEFDLYAKNLASTQEITGAGAHFDLVAADARKEVLSKVGLLEKRATMNQRVPQGTEEQRQAIQRSRQVRWRFLLEVYEDSRRLKAGRLQSLPSASVRDTLGISDDDRSLAEDYLKDKGLIKFVAMGPTVAITGYGIDYVERALADPDEESEFFPPVTVMNVWGGIHHSQVQQGAVHSQQAMTVQQFEPETLRELIGEIRHAAETLALDTNERADLDADLDTLSAQLKRSTPMQTVVRETLLSAKTILEGAGGALVAMKIAAVLGIAAAAS